MTKREAAIVSAYTGILIGEFENFNGYVEEIMGRSVWTHELPYIADEIKEKSKKDFMSIKIKNEDKKKEEINMGCKFKDRCPSYSGWCEGIDEPNADCISDILTVYENEGKRTKDLEWIYYFPRENYGMVDFDAIERALGIRLFIWQKSYILRQGFRAMGRTTAEILQMLFDKDQYDNPIDFSKPPRNIQKHIFRQQFRDIWEKLHDAGIEMRPVLWNKEDKKSYDAEHYDHYKYARTWFDEYEKGEQNDN